MLLLLVAVTLTTQEYSGGVGIVIAETMVGMEAAQCGVVGNVPTEATGLLATIIGRGRVIQKGVGLVVDPMKMSGGQGSFTTNVAVVSLH